MSDQGEKTCPLCAEEMDLTDQQLKPCKCGYEICVWCWHHILEMAEKENTEGRCPACRVPYDKEKIVGMAAKCERLVAEINMEKKSKSQKSKTKPSEGRKQLGSVRVIQRNLVYVVGLPLNLADEDLLQHREYFGQYGKVLKVSMSRTSAGVIQQFPNNTCSVYITYSKEEEAIRCIQSVHGFILDGRPLRVCFGTTKYCHAWLRNMPCTNPDCLYLHEVGSQEDSFTKDEIISAYTRVQQITGNGNTLQRRSGNMLPPPVDDYCSNSAASTGKPVVKNAPNTTSAVKVSPPNGINGRSIALPAAASWGTRASSFQSSEVSSGGSDGASRERSELVDGKPLLSSVVGDTVKSSTAQNNVIKKPQINDEINTFPTLSKVHSSNSLKQHPDAPASDKHVAADVAPVAKVLNNNLSYLPPTRDGNRVPNILLSVTTTSDSVRQSCTTGPEKAVFDYNDVKIGTDANEASGGTIPKPSSANSLLVESLRNQGSQQQLYSENKEAGASKLVALNDGISADHCDWKLDSQNLVTGAHSGVEEDILSFDSQRLNDPLLVRPPNSASLIHPAGHMRPDPYCQNEANGFAHLHVDSLLMDKKYNDSHLLHQSGGSVSSNGYHDNDNLLGGSASLRSLQGSTYLLPREAKETTMVKPVNSAANSDSSPALDIGESSIISNILSLDLDAWDDSLTSPQDLARLLGRNDEQAGSFKTLSPWKVQNSNQSRFSFARQEESTNQSLGFEPSFNVSGQLPVKEFPQPDVSENRESYMDKIGVPNGFHPQIFAESDSFAGSHFAISPKRSSVSRSQMLAPPGFSVPSKAPPPGFSSRERLDQGFETMSRTNSQEALSLLRNSHAPQMNGNIVSAADIEFMDPAILAVGKGRLHNGINSSGLDVRSFPQQANAFENESRLQLLMQGSLSPQQNLRYIMGDGYASLGENLGMPSRVLDRPQAGNLSPFAQLSLQQSRNSLMSNGHWDGWNGIQGGNGLGMAELLRNERLGLNRFYDGYEDSKYGMSTSGDLYKRTFGMG